jgi:tetratricopeptide (TPR) repeat protein
MINRWCIFILFCTLTSQSHAGINRDFFSRMSDEEQFRFADKYFIRHWFDYQDSTKRAAAIDDFKFMLTKAKGAKTTCLLKLFWFRNQLDGRLTLADTPDEEIKSSLAYINNLVSFTKDHQPDLIVEGAICHLALCMSTLAHRGSVDTRTRRLRVFDIVVQNLNVLENQPLSRLHQYHGAVFDIDYHLLWISTYLFRIHELELAYRISLLVNRVVHPVLSTKAGHDLGYYHYKWISSINLGSYCLKENRLDEAADWFRKAYQLGKKQPSEIREAVAGGYLGVVWYKKNKPESAVQPLERAVSVSRATNDKESEFNAIVPLSEVYLSLQQYDKAYITLTQALELFKSLRYNVVLGPTDSTDMIPLFRGLSEVYEHQGNIKEALYYSQLTNDLEIKLREIDDSRKFRQKEERLAAKAYRARLNQMETNRKQEISHRNAAIAVAVVVLLISFLYLYYQRKRRIEAEHQLARVIQEARIKTGQLTQLQREDTVNDRSMTDESLLTISELMQKAILTEADWERFRMLFERVYPNYLLRLRRTFPMLTPAEIRIICLSRLSLSTKEMGDMLGVSTDTIIKTRYRIRKKANLSEGADLNKTFSEV